MKPWVASTRKFSCNYRQIRHSEDHSGSSTGSQWAGGEEIPAKPGIVLTGKREEVREDAQWPGMMSQTWLEAEEKWTEEGAD